jgi:hypothetical protein
MLVVGCTSTDVVRYPDAPQGLSPVPTDSVRVYSDTSKMCDYERIAGLQISGSTQGMEDATREEAIQKTADLGGNALLLGKTVNQGGSLRDYAGNTISGFAALLEDRPCDDET